MANTSTAPVNTQTVSIAATLDLDELGKKIVYPPTEQYNKGLYLTVLDDSAMGLYDTAWTEFKQKASIQ